MAKFGPLALAGIVVACSGWARAADLPPAPSLPPPSSADSEFGGWYLRGDAGVGVNLTAPDLQTAGAVGRTFDDTAVSPSGMIDVGGGYQFNGMFRADGTLEYRALARLRSLSTPADRASPLLGGPAPFGGSDRADVASFVGLINGYVTPGAWYGFRAIPGRRRRLRRQSTIRRPCRWRIEDQLRLGADGWSRLRSHFEPEGRGRVPLSELWLDWRRRALLAEQARLQRLQVGTYLSDRRRAIGARRRRVLKTGGFIRYPAVAAQTA